MTTIVEEEVKTPKSYWADNDDMWTDKSLLDAYKNLSTLIYRYNKMGTDIDPTQDTETVHSGVSAQEIEQVPELKSAVVEIPTENGNMKALDTRELTTSNTAALAEVARKLEDFDKRLRILEERSSSM